MSDPYLGEIRMFGGNFAPEGWVLCDGRSLAISQNEVLFTLLGTAYGGDGTNTFNVPNLSGRVPIHQGNAPGMQNYVLGDRAGVESVTLAAANLPQHSHPFQTSIEVAKASDPKGKVLAQNAQALLYAQRAPNVQLAPAALTAAPGGSQPHENRMPTLAVTFIIATSGLFPPRN